MPCCLNRVIDLRNLTREQGVAFNKGAVDIREKVAQLRPPREDLYWWVGSLSSRNPDMSPLFKRCCWVAFVLDCVEQDEGVEEVLVPDACLAKVLRGYFREQKKAIRVRQTEDFGARVKRWLEPGYGFAKLCYYLMMRWMGRSRRGNMGVKRGVPLTLLDTFVLKGKSGGIVNGEYQDRYYPGLLEHLKPEERARVYYVTALHGFKNPWLGFRKIRGAKGNFIIPDDFLKGGDYLHLLLYPLRCLRQKMPKMFICGVDMGRLLRQEKWQKCCDFSSVLGVLNYRFMRRLREAGVEVRLLVEWYENQAIDRGMILGTKHFFPRAEVIGYQGYFTSLKYHIHRMPTAFEVESGVVPHRIGIMGCGHKKRVMVYTEALDLQVVPALRFQHVWKGIEAKEAGGVFRVLVSLPILLEESERILRWIWGIADTWKGAGVEFWIKRHPGCCLKKIKKRLLQRHRESLIFKEGGFHSRLEVSDLLVSNASSTSVEALARGVPVIVIENPGGITQNPIPDDVDKRLWRACYSEEEVRAGIRFFKEEQEQGREDYQRIAEDVRRRYFEPVTAEGVRDFLGFSG